MTRFRRAAGLQKRREDDGRFCRNVPLTRSAMPKVKRSRKPPPDGWELIEPTLDELDQKMREGEEEEVEEEAQAPRCSLLLAADRGEAFSITPPPPPPPPPPGPPQVHRGPPAGPPARPPHTSRSSVPKRREAPPRRVRCERVNAEQGRRNALWAPGAKPPLSPPPPIFVMLIFINELGLVFQTF